MAAIVGMELLIDQGQIDKAILEELVEKLNERITLAKPLIKISCGEIVKTEIRNSPTYLAMMPGGELYGQIGVIDIKGVVESIIDKIIEEIDVVPIFCKVVGSQIVGGVEVGILETSYESLLRLEGTSFTSQGDNANLVDWLRWLLFRGSEPVVFTGDQPFEYDDEGIHPESRTGEGIMKKATIGWGFPEEYAGTSDDNWLTKVMVQIERDVGNVLGEELAKVL